MSNAFTHTNRRGDVYHLQSKPAKKGGVKYSFARKLSGEPVGAMPEGYEARELPDNSQVVIRKVLVSEIKPSEKKELEKMIAAADKRLRFIVDVEKEALVVYVSDVTDKDVAWCTEPIDGIAPMNAQAKKGWMDYLYRMETYTKMMRFTLDDKKSRLFSVDRWCFLGSIDKWYYLESGEMLKTLAAKYVKHLGKESFFELM